ncbi:MAG: ParM/StbA family protein [Thiohalocapsa sp.]|nr:ParM/StbA family protein [Thiohalocapsa sp.]
MQVVGLDIGYSNLKVAFGQAGERPRLRVLPAIAAPRAHVAAQLEGLSQAGTAGIAVRLDGEEWIVGVRPTQISGWQRALHADYAASDSYRALLLSALSLLPFDRVDRLVTGLPVSQAADAGRREALRAIILGRHALGPGVIEVADVRVIAQPVGSYIDVLMHAGDDIVDVIGDGTVLVIDVGYFSVDWAVLVNGDLRRTATGTSLEATSVLIEAAAAFIGADRGGKPPTAAIERSLAEQRADILYRGERIPLARYLDRAAKQTGQVALEALRRDLRREHTEVDLILLTGGGSALFAPLVRTLFDRVPLHVPADPVGANARGYFYYGGR